MYSSTVQQTFVYILYAKLKTMAAKNCIQNIYKILSKCRIHFFMETFCIILYILYTNILIYKKCTS